MRETIFGICPGKSNQYIIGVVNGQHRIVKSDIMKKYERSFINQCFKYKGRNISTPFRLIVDVYYPDYTHDLDNSLKGVLDNLQYVGAITNDNLCHEIVATRHYDKWNPRIEFEIQEINEQKRLF